MHFTRFVEDNIDFLARYLRRLGIPVSEVDDAVQEVLWVVHKKQAQIESGKERAFLVAIGTRVASHEYRARRRRSRTQGEFCDQAALTHELTPERLTQVAESRERLQQVLNQLPMDLRTIFVLFELEQMTAPEVSELLEIPVGTATSRIRRARALFSESVGEAKSDLSLKQVS